MTRTQIQLPDDIYARAKKVAEAREVSLAELTREGLEYILSVYEPDPAADWQLPKPRKLGWKNLTEEQLKEQAQRTSPEATVASKRGQRR